MRLPRSVLAVLALTLSSGAMIGTSPGASAATHTVTPLNFKVQVGATGDKTCNIVGDLYTPATASATSPVPAILTTNGFGGSKNDQAGIGKAFAAKGYAVLSYSGLGFGGSGCKITLDDPDFDGKAASQLVSYLGGKTGIAFTDAAHTTPAPALTVVKRDGTGDPRVGMVGGSYGGQVQFAAASVDPRIDTIVPIVTWNDLSYSLGPNNTTQTQGVSTSTPGSVKLQWGLGFSALGVVNGLQNAPSDPSRLLPCPNFADFVCPALVTGGLTGFFDNPTIAAMRHASVASYIPKIKVPVLLIQGQNDTLFNLNEGVATYEALRAQKTPVKMIWQWWGHSESKPAPGEIDLANPDSAKQYETKRIEDWFKRYLKGDTSINTGPQFSYFRDWISYTGTAAPAYASSSKYPVGTASKYYLSSGSQLVKAAPKASTQSFLTPVLGAPTSIEALDLPVTDLPEIDLPGTFATWSTPTLTAPVTVVGSPKLTLTVNSPLSNATQLAGPTGQLVLFAKLVDVGPDGKGKVVRNLVAPVRIPDATKPFTVTMPGISYRFAKGHQLKLVVAGGSSNYRGNLTPAAVNISSGSTAQVLSLPVVP